MSTKSSKKFAKNLRTPSTRQKSRDDWHKNIAAARGEKWKANVLEGRREVQLNPSNIRILRLRKKLMQSAFAKKLGISESAFGAIERGHQPVSKERAAQISDMIDAPLAKLFKAKGKKFVAVVQKPNI